MFDNINMKQIFNLRIKAFLAVLLVILTFGTLIRLIHMDITDSNRDIVMVMLGALQGFLGSVIGYYFGSSHSEKDISHLKENENKTE